VSPRQPLVAGTSVLAATFDADTPSRVLSVASSQPHRDAPSKAVLPNTRTSLVAFVLASPWATPPRSSLRSFPEPSSRGPFPTLTSRWYPARRVHP